MQRLKKPWAGRFKEKTRESVESFTESISFDRRLSRYDIEGSIAHAKMLGKTGIIPIDESKRIIQGLKDIGEEIKAGRFKFMTELEDIHMNIESELTRKIGTVGEKLHTGRSRNDQIALDMRLYLRAETKKITALLRGFQKTLLFMAETHITTIMPGYTHLQRAQPVLLSHHLLAYVEMLKRDIARLSDCLKRINILPLGSCAMAGTSLPIDRQYTARLLGFERVSQNSIDAVSDRDFLIEFIFCLSIIMMHLSRMAEELTLWAGEEFSFIELPDAFSTGSSIMPQKKNPDVPELIRGKTGRVFGSLISLLTMMKGIPLSYNRDMQEDKPPVFDSIDTVKASLFVLNEMLPEIRFNRERMLKAVTRSYSTATDMTEYLVRKGMPFRKAHAITGKLVLYAIKKEKNLDELSLGEIKRFSALIEKDIYPVLTPEGSIKAKVSEGGTSPVEVRRQIRRLRRQIKAGR
ncbi:MAG: argininosuccinate lyase [Nitrospirae bacterium]|nr:argininosuccinate lyase [Nitrospirota bacterium]